MALVSLYLRWSPQIRGALALIGGPEVQDKEILEDLCGFFLKSKISDYGVSNSSVTGNAGTFKYLNMLTGCV